MRHARQEIAGILCVFQDFLTKWDVKFSAQTCAGIYSEFPKRSQGMRYTTSFRVKTEMKRQYRAGIERTQAHMLEIF